MCDRSTDPEGRAIAARRWSFGDGFFAVEPCLAHPYDRAGAYTISLAVEDDWTQSDSVSTRVAVQSASVMPVKGLASVGSAVARPSPPAPAPTVTYRDRVRTVTVPMPIAPPVAEDQHLKRLANPPRVLLAASRTVPGRAALTGVLVLVILGLLLVVIARRRARTGTREYDRMTTDFLSNLSHELRTPLTPVKGFAEILGRHRVSSAKARTYAGAILDASEKLERVIDTLVGVAEIDAGRDRADRDRLDLVGLVMEAVEPWRVREPARAFRCAGSSVDAVVDRRLIALAVDQLVDNAVKFSSADAEVYIDVRSDGARVVIEVTDDGIGIAAEDQAVIFGDFRQVDGSTTRAHGGLGLGLALVRRVARMHDGEITVRSTPGSGSTFTLSLPGVASRRHRAAA